jgi:hypothetical protein
MHIRKAAGKNAKNLDSFRNLHNAEPGRRCSSRFRSGTGRDAMKGSRRTLPVSERMYDANQGSLVPDVSQRRVLAESLDSSMQAMLQSVERSAMTINESMRALAEALDRAVTYSKDLETLVREVSNNRDALQARVEELEKAYYE